MWVVPSLKVLISVSIWELTSINGILHVTYQSLTPTRLRGTVDKPTQRCDPPCFPRDENSTVAECSEWDIVFSLSTHKAMKTHFKIYKIRNSTHFFYTSADACFSSKMSCVENTVCNACVVYRGLLMLCGSSEIRTVWSLDLATYSSMSVFVCVPDTWCTCSRKGNIQNVAWSADVPNSHQGNTQIASSLHSHPSKFLHNEIDSSCRRRSVCWRMRQANKSGPVDIWSEEVSFANIPVLESSVPLPLVSMETWVKQGACVCMCTRKG